MWIASGVSGGIVRGGGVKKYLTPRGFGILKVLDELSAETGATPSQITLAWTMSRPAVAAPIVSATNTQQLADILKAVDVKLDAAAIARLDAASATQAAAA